MSYEELQRQTRYLAPFTRWACAVVLKGPRWVPAVVRRVPLNVATLMMSAHVLAWRLSHG